jgi:quercetin dioxygenase-like cupin family protein
MIRRFALALIAVAVLAAPAAALDDSKYQTLLTPVLTTGADILGQPVTYPPGPLKVTAAIVTVPPGGETGWHLHEVPLFAYILEGSLTVDYGEKGVRTYQPGTGIIEAMNWSHNGKNEGTVPVKLLAVYMGSGEKTNTVVVPDPNPPPAPKPEIQ